MGQFELKVYLFLLKIKFTQVTCGEYSGSYTLYDFLMNKNETLSVNQPVGYKMDRYDLSNFEVMKNHSSLYATPFI